MANTEELRPTDWAEGYEFDLAITGKVIGTDGWDTVCSGQLVVTDEEGGSDPRSVQLRIFNNPSHSSQFHFRIILVQGSTD